MAQEQERLEAALGAVEDPELGLTLAQLGLVRGVRRRRRRFLVEVGLPVAAWPGRDELAERIHRRAADLVGPDAVDLEFVVMTDEQRADLRHRLRAVMTSAMPTQGGSGALDHDHGQSHDHGQGHDHGHTHDHSQGHDPAGSAEPAFLAPESKTRVIGISSGKGGVGKSTVTVNLAIALAQAGHRVGLLDADVYGFSVPGMLGADHDPVVIGDIVIPTAVHGVRCLSMGYFVPDDQPVIWRGPMLHKAIQQFLTDAYWGEPDFVIVDMPPGTGDVALTLAQVMPRAEIVVVTTPQAAAQRVAQRSAFAARRLKLAVRGVIENMSWFTGDDGTRYELFGSGGGATLAADLGVPLLGQVPLVPAVRRGGDEGKPVVALEPTGEPALAFRSIADRLAGLGPARVYRKELTLR